MVLLAYIFFCINRSKNDNHSIKRFQTTITTLYWSLLAVILNISREGLIAMHHRHNNKVPQRIFHYKSHNISKIYGLFFSAKVLSKNNTVFVRIILYAIERSPKKFFWSMFKIVIRCRIVNLVMSELGGQAYWISSQLMNIMLLSTPAKWSVDTSVMWIMRKTIYEPVCTRDQVSFCVFSPKSLSELSKGMKSCCTPCYYVYSIWTV